MFTQVIVDPALSVGNVVKYDATASRWNAAQDASGLIGVISSAPLEDGLANVQFAGISFALSSQNIPDEGGNLGVENGKVFVTTATGAGVIAPKDKNEDSRTSDQLVMIHVR